MLRLCWLPEAARPDGRADAADAPRKVVEKVFDMIEYRLALQERRRGAAQPRERVAYEATYSHAG